MSKLSAPHFTNEDAARTYLEELRWPAGSVCPHCGINNKAYATKRLSKYRCAMTGCRKDFTVKAGTVFVGRVRQRGGNSGGHGVACGRCKFGHRLGLPIAALGLPLVVGLPAPQS